MAKNYRDEVARLITQCTEGGMSQKDIAEKLGFKTPNNVSMLVGKNRHNLSALPLTRLPTLVKLCGLNAKEALALVKLRAMEDADCSTAFSLEFMQEMMRWTVQALDMHRLEKAKVACVATGARA